MCVIYIISIAFVSSDLSVTVVRIKNLTFLSECLIWIFILSFLDLFYLPIVGVGGYCCTRSHPVVRKHAHTHMLVCACVHGRTSLYVGLALCRGLYLHSTQHSQETEIHAPGRIRTYNPSRWAVTDLHLTWHSHWHLSILHRYINLFCISYFMPMCCSCPPSPLVAAAVHYLFFYSIVFWVSVKCSAGNIVGGALHHKL